LVETTLSAGDSALALLIDELLTLMASLEFEPDSDCTTVSTLQESERLSILGLQSDLEDDMVGYDIR
jgi:hypothetical protein